jgi:hypothetical protein
MLLFLWAGPHARRSRPMRSGPPYLSLRWSPLLLHWHPPPPHTGLPDPIFVSRRRAALFLSLPHRPFLSGWSSSRPTTLLPTASCPSRVTGASPKPSVAIVHLPSRSLHRWATPIDLRCRCHVEEHRDVSLLLPNPQADASELSSGWTLASPSALTAPPWRRHSGESRCRLPCPTPPPCHTSTRTAAHSTPHCEAGRCRPRRPGTPASGDHPRVRPAARRGSGRVDQFRSWAVPPPLSLGPESAQHCSSVFNFEFLYLFQEILFNFQNLYKFVDKSEKYKINFYRVLKSKSVQ